MATLEVTPNLSIRAGKLNAYLNAYNEACIYIPNKTTEEKELIIYSTMLVDYIKETQDYQQRPDQLANNVNGTGITQLYQQRFNQLNNYWQRITGGNSNITNNPSVEAFLDYLISQMWEVIAQCHEVIRSNQTVVTLQTEGINQSDLSQEIVNRLIDRYNNLPQGKVLDVSHVNYTTLQGIREVNRPRSTTNAKYGVDEINIISNDWNRYLFVISLLNPDLLNLPSIANLNQRLQQFNSN